MNLIKPLNCIIVDDEDGAHLVITHHLEGLKSMRLCGSFYNAKDAMDFIYNHPVDLIFLDINMPGLNGMEMLEAMARPPLVILTTAYSAYALESYKYQVVDYLLKPIALPQFLAAIDKAIARYRPATTTSPVPSDNSQTSLILKVDGDFVKIDTKTIEYIQSWGNYVKVFIHGSAIVSAITTNEIERKLDKTQFIRIHKSYIVALHRVQKISGNMVYLNDSFGLPLGNTYRKEVLERFSG